MTGVYSLNVGLHVANKVTLGQTKLRIICLLMWCLFYGAEKTGMNFASDPRQTVMLSLSV